MLLAFFSGSVLQGAALLTKDSVVIKNNKITD